MALTFRAAADPGIPTSGSSVPSRASIPSPHNALNAGPCSRSAGTNGDASRRVAIVWGRTARSAARATQSHQAIQRIDPVYRQAGRRWRGAGRSQDDGIAMDRLLQVEDFEPLVGRVFRFKGTRFAFPLDRIAGTDRSAMPGLRRQPFILIFAGPREREHLPDGLYECEVDGGPTFRLFVNPIHTPEPDRQDYPAVFT